MNIGTATSRVRLLPELDAVQLGKASVLVVGNGNVGSQAASQAALTGVGHLAIIDRDVVGEENLISPVFSVADIGKRKTEAVKRWIEQHAPWTRVDAYDGNVLVDIPEYVFGAYDAVMLATDNWASKGHGNRYAHRILGKVRVIVSGGLFGLSWDIITSVPGSNSGCLECIHGAEVVRADEEGGCGLSGHSTREHRPDPSAGFTGGAVASMMVSEVVSTLAGPGPRFAGKLLSFNYGNASFQGYKIVPNDDCIGHKPVGRRETSITLPLADYSLIEIAAHVAALCGVHVNQVALTSEREMVAGGFCKACSHEIDVWRPLLAITEQDTRCAQCGAELALRTETVLPVDARRLPDFGYPVGKALLAYVAGEKIEVLQLPEVHT